MENFILAFLLILSAQTLRSQQISNVSFETSGKQVVVSYYLSGGASSGYTIFLYYNINDGPWQGPLKSVTGNVGAGEKAGIGKQITWNVLSELEKLTGEISFKVQAEPFGTFKDSRDGRTYKTIGIGTQTWMAENLAWLPSVSPSKTGSEEEKYYYEYGYEGIIVIDALATTNYAAYGVLYNWPVALKACPSGWHLPTDAEWTKLTNFIGTPAGGKMKEIGIRHWTSPNTGATNSSGFSTFPGGNRDGNGDFEYLGLNADFWSASENDASKAWRRYLGYDSDGVYRNYDIKSYGFSARCLQN